MKRFMVLAAAVVLVFGLGTSTASAAGNSLRKGSMGFSAGFDSNGAPLDKNVGTNISGRYFFSNNLALTATVGMETHGADADEDYFSIGAGMRYYLDGGEFALFVGGGLTVVQDKAKNAVGTTIRDDSMIDFNVGFGGEYFLHPQFSLEAQVGLGFGTIEDGVTNTDDTYFGSRTIGVSANVYF